MKVLAINGSHRKDGNTKILLDEVLNECKKEGAECELVQLAYLKIEYCQAHDSSFCREKGCVFKDDLPGVLEKMVKADAIIIGSPVYLGSVSSRLKAFMDRSVILRRRNFSLSAKVGAGIAVGGAQGGGQEFTLSAIHNFFLIHDMTVVSDGIDTAHFGVVSVADGAEGAKDDQLAIEMAYNLGKRVIKELKLRNK